MNTNRRAVFALLASLSMAGCAGGSRAELEAENQSVAAAAAAVEAQTVEAKDLPAPEPRDLLAKARAIAASKGLGGGEDEARARAALAPLSGGGNQTGDAQSTFQRAAMRFDAQGRGERQERSDQLDASDPREIFRKAQALAHSRASDAAKQDARAFGALAPAQNPLIAKPETYFVEALRLRQQQSALALGRSLQ